MGIFMQEATAMTRTPEANKTAGANPTTVGTGPRKVVSNSAKLNQNAPAGRGSYPVVSPVLRDLMDRLDNDIIGRR